MSACGGRQIAYPLLLPRLASGYISLQARQRDPALYQPLTRTRAAVAGACLAVGAARPTPLLLGLALVLLLGVPWGLAVAHHLANAAKSPPK